MLKFISAAAVAAEAEELSFGEIMSKGGSTLLIGMGTVFAVLIVLWLAVALMGRVLGAATKKSAPAVPAKASAPAPAPAPVAPAPVVEEAISPEVIAAISAAIAQFEGPAAPRLVIRSVRRSTQWNGGRR